MRFIMRFIVFLHLTLFLTACLPIYKKEYVYTPPLHSIGKTCISQCMAANKHCDRLCELRKVHCTKRMTADACKVSCQCQSAFNTCYQACGGTVDESKVCIKNCGK